MVFASNTDVEEGIGAGTDEGGGRRIGGGSTATGRRDGL
jgi:hypothetical protein